MKILLFGENGQIAWELRRALSVMGDLAIVGRANANFENPERLGAIVKSSEADVVVNAAAYTSVDRAEAEPDRAHAINATAVEHLAVAAKHSDAWLVHFSSDYVFDGNKEGPYRETDLPNPGNVYGRSKKAGEDAIVGSGCKHLIFRTSWVHAPRGANFVRTILRLAGERDQLHVVADQFGAPTSAELVADATSQAIAAIRNPARRLPSGIYHLTAGGKTSWHQFARFVVTEAMSLGHKSRLLPDAIQPIPTSGYPLPARRPANSLLDTEKLRNATGIVLPDWTYHARRSVSELVEQART